MPTKSSASMKVTEQLVAEIESTDADGNPTDPNTVVWTSSDESIAVVVPQPGGLKASIIAGNVGNCKVVVNANAAKGNKAKPVLGVLDLTVHAGEVAEVKITTQPPVEQGTAPSQGLPSRPARPSQGLPSGGHPSTGVPPNVPSQGLPGGPPPRPGQGLPPTPGTKPGDEEDDEHIPGASPKRR